MRFRVAFGHMEKHRVIDYTKVVYSDIQKANYEFSGPFAYLKHHFSDLVKVAFFNAQDSEFDFTWPFFTLKQLFIDFTIVVL
jgi:hypothetical protein